MVIRLGDPFTGAFMVHSDSFLYLSRHNIYYFRAIVPEGIREELHKREYRRSMQTRSLQVARNMARVMRVCFETHLERIKLYMISWEELREILDNKLVQLMSQEKEHLKKVGPYPLDANDIWQQNVIPGYQQSIQAISQFRSDRMSGITSGELPEFAKNLAEEILQSTNTNLDRSSNQFIQFCEATVQMFMEYYKQRILLNDEMRSFQVDQPFYAPSCLSAFKQVDSKPISEIVEIFCEEMVAGKNWTEKTESEYRAAYKLLISLTNDMPIASVDNQVSQFFKTTLQKLPSNMNKKALYRDKPIKEVAAMKIPKEDLLSITKVNSYMGRISQFFKWAHKNSHTKSNPFEGIGIKQKIADRDKRIVFINSDYKALFSTPIFQNGEFKHPYYYWLPLLGLFTGARIDELCQLYLDDIYQKDDLWVIDFNYNLDKKLKTSSSKRIIPMHSRLIKWGLVEYAADLRKKGKVRLFPELKKGRDGYSQAASKWFSRYRISCGVTDDRKTFHSFRHTVDNDLKQRKEIVSIIKAVLGHLDDDMTTGLYGMAYEPSTLVSVIESLDFPIEIKKYVP